MVLHLCRKGHGKKKQSSTSGKSRTNPEDRKLPTTLHDQAKAATEFVSAIFCRRYLRNVTAVLSLQFFVISGLLLLATFNKEVHKLTSKNWEAVIIANGVCFLIIAITLILFNKLYRKSRSGNYVPLVLITANITGLLVVPVVKFNLYPIIAVTLAVAFYSFVMTLDQIIFSSELSLPSGLLSIILANTVLGAGTVAVLLHGFKTNCPAYVFFITEAVATLIWAYLLYDLELMTTEPATHKLLEYGVVYDSEAYATLHLCVDFLHMVLRIPKYFYTCARAGLKPFYQPCVPRSCLGMRCGENYAQENSASESEDEPDDAAQKLPN